MPTSSQDITDTDVYTVYASKAAFQADVNNLLESEGAKGALRSKLIAIQYRLSNTDTDNWTAASDSRHDD